MTPEDSEENDEQQFQSKEDAFNLDYQKRDATKDKKQADAEQSDAIFY